MIQIQTGRMHIDKNTIITVLMGGVSTERQVSLTSGQAVVDRLQKNGYMVLPIVIDTDDTGEIIKQITPAPDVIFNALHGTFGEDGGIQKILNTLNIPYTHSGYRASRIAINKPQTIMRYKNAGIPVAPSVRMHTQDFKPQNLPFAPPYVIKPAFEGSSVGLHIVHTKDDIPNLKDWQYGDIMVEKFISGVELTVSVLNNQAIGITELVPISGVYDYEAKYTDGKTEHKCNQVSISVEVANLVKSYAVHAHKLLGCRGVSRTDFRYDTDTNTLATLETNTHPGLTPLSLLPEQAQHMGLSFLDLILHLLSTATVD